MGAGAAILGLVLALAGCAGDSYPPAKVASDVVGTWIHGPGRLVLNSDSTFVMTNMPKYVVDGLSNERHGPVVSCSGKWGILLEDQNMKLYPDSATCRSSGLFVTGRDSQRTIAFGLDTGSANPLCFELVRSHSKLTPRGVDECSTY